jgi:surface-anchored protein
MLTATLLLHCDGESAGQRDDSSQPSSVAGAGGSGAGGGAASSVSSSAAAGAGGEDCALWYEEGHGDLFVSYDPDTEQLTLWIRAQLAEPTETLHSLDDVCIHVPRSTYDEVLAAGGRPVGNDWDSTGVEAHEPFWLLPQSPVPGVPWFGLSTEGGPPAEILSGDISLAYALAAVPLGGQLSQYSVGTFGNPVFLLSSSAGELSYSRPPGIHEHLNWTFSSPGWWWVDVVATAPLSDGVLLSSPPGRLRMWVEP